MSRDRAATRQPAAGPPGPAAAPDRRPVRHGALRRHRRPVPQEDHAGDLRPGEPRPAAARLQPGRLRPPRLGRPGLRADRARLGQGARADRVPRGGLAPARRGLPVRARATSPTTSPSTSCGAPSRSSTRSRGTAGNHAFYLSIPPKFFGDVVQQLEEHGLAEPDATAPGGGWSSRSRSATTWRRPASSTTSSTASSRPSRCSASTTTSARRPCRTSWRCGSPTRCSSRSGTPTTSTTCRSRWPRTSASAAGPATTTASAPPATSSRTTCSS